MATTHGDSLTDLERQAESSRAELAQTVDELHNRVSPQTLKEDMRNYARDRSQHMLHSIEARARENPLQAVAIAAGIAYPLWRLIGSVPAPLLMIGAGLALSGRGNSHRSTSLGEGYQRPGDPAHLHGEEGGSIAATAKEKVSNIGHQISEKVSDTISSVRDMATDAKTTASDMLHDTYRSGGEAASGAMRQASDSYVRTRETMGETIERYPLLVGGLAFAIGSLVASALPVTRQENRLMGRTSEEVRRRTQQVASEGLDQAKTAARNIYETAAAGVKEEGLSPDVARDTVRAASDAVRDAVDQTFENGTMRQPKPRPGRSPRNQTN
ncbi:DUF3618 domain-containing protein [Aestuariivirga sp.]|uniref:DUF3618 domain-containing protein n=1 Tax=Aestuariivirga sp. TaxID=2650926 RepID=UPI00391C15D2